MPLCSRRHADYLMPKVKCVCVCVNSKWIRLHLKEYWKVTNFGRRQMSIFATNIEHTLEPFVTYQRIDQQHQKRKKWKNQSLMQTHTQRHNTSFRVFTIWLRTHSFFYFSMLLSLFHSSLHSIRFSPSVSWVSHGMHADFISTFWRCFKADKLNRERWFFFSHVFVPEWL